MTTGIVVWDTEILLGELNTMLRPMLTALQGCRTSFFPGVSRRQPWQIAGSRDHEIHVRAE
ncbi:hypothetical protein [Pseudoclavibacter sp. 13-3]|uniref:hypothetical protein n=1 Tax=Pseudoclavibacter sp. 13-3 TaxID=2901228 RepID=UPI001E5B0F0D|nr:hypothetical protein [Pseudoclavibacter sp. 13-3]MCD7101070.1 hypothetical protein [Pseudoclavibacter sp. 13-3]